MRAREAEGRPVVDLGTATTVSEVTGFAVGRELTSIVGVRVGKRRKAVWLDWSQLVAFGPDAATISMAPPATFRTGGWTWTTW